MLTDWPLERLREYRPERVEPPNFAEFWRGTLDSARTAAAPARFRPYDAGLTTVEVYDLTFTGFGGHPIRGWFFLPRGGQEPLPCVVEYIGYGGGRGLPHEWLHWSAAGLPVGVMLAARPGEEELLLSLAAQVEAAAPWAERHPPGW